MDYHRERFSDNSLMFYENGVLLALLPATSKDDALVSHPGLSYGGVLSGVKMRTEKMCKLFSSLKDYALTSGFSSLHYKAIPSIYHKSPAEEDLYALNVSGAQLIRRDVSSSICLSENFRMQERRKRAIKSANNAGVEITCSGSLDIFWNLLEENLSSRYGVTPVHSLKEITQLSDKFPDNIKLHQAQLEGEVLAGVLVFETETVAHAQYIASSVRGKELEALSLLFSELLFSIYTSKRYFDFGISTEQNGEYLNTSLMDFKESFGARAKCFDFYKLNFSI